MHAFHGAKKLAADLKEVIRSNVNSEYAVWVGAQSEVFTKEANCSDLSLRFRSIKNLLPRQPRKTTLVENKLGIQAKSLAEGQ